jgi:hypothetical protein
VVCVIDLPDNSIVGAIGRNGNDGGVYREDGLAFCYGLGGELTIAPTEGSQHIALAVDVKQTVPIGSSRENVVELVNSSLHGLNDVVTGGGK